MPKVEMPLVGLYAGPWGSIAFQAAHWLANQLAHESTPLAWIGAAHSALPCGHIQQHQMPANYPLIFHGTSYQSDETAQAAFECLTALSCQVLHAIVPLEDAFVPAFIAAYQQWPLVLTPWPWSEASESNLTIPWILAHTSVLLLPPGHVLKRPLDDRPPIQALEWDHLADFQQLYRKAVT